MNRRKIPDSHNPAFDQPVAYLLCSRRRSRNNTHSNIHPPAQIRKLFHRQHRLAVNPGSAFFLIRIKRRNYFKSVFRKPMITQKRLTKMPGSNDNGAIRSSVP